MNEMTKENNKIWVTRSELRKMLQEAMVTEGGEYCDACDRPKDQCVCADQEDEGCH